MHYIIYPEGISRLENSGLKKKIDDASRSLNRHFGHFFKEDIYGVVKELENDQLYSRLPQDEKSCFMSSMKNLCNSSKPSTWEVLIDGTNHTGSGNSMEESEHLLNLIGLSASQVLSPEEVGNYRALGFNSVGELLGTVGAYIKNGKDRWFRPAGMWQTKIRGRTLENNISATEHLDLALFRTETTPHETTDPLGNKVCYRPVLERDNQTVFSYQNGEEILMPIILKWADQENLPSELLARKGNRFFEYVRSLQPGYEPGDMDIGNALVSTFFYNLPIFNSGTTSRVFLPKVNLVYKGDDSSLLFVNSNSKEMQAQYFPQEVDDMIRGLCVQAHKGVGRTSLTELANIVHHRFSQEFQEEISS